MKIVPYRIIILNAFTFYLSQLRIKVLVIYRNTIHSQINIHGRYPDGNPSEMDRRIDDLLSGSPLKFNI